MAAAFSVVVALALAGTAPLGATRFPSLPQASASAAAPAPRARVTTLDAARASVPLPPVTTPVPAASPPPSPAPSPERASRSSARPRVAGDALWAALARCESSGNPAARSADGRYSGAFQFSDATWQSLGFDGRAADYPYSVQVEAAKRLQARSGWSQWPRCARRLGLR
jgi:hypothetical protein